MINEMIIGIIMNVLVMMVHLGATILLLGLVRALENRLNRKPYLSLMASLLVVNITLLTAHLIGVSMWASLYNYLQLVPTPGDAFYSALVNYTTLGYGDELQATRTRLLGPMAAASGILMFGWSTALLIFVLQLRLPHLVGTQKSHPPATAAH